MTLRSARVSAVPAQVHSSGNNSEALVADTGPSILSAESSAGASAVSTENPNLVNPEGLAQSDEVINHRSPTSGSQSVTQVLSGGGVTFAGLGVMLRNRLMSTPVVHQDDTSRTVIQTVGAGVDNDAGNIAQPSASIPRFLEGGRRDSATFGLGSNLEANFSNTSIHMDARLPVVAAVARNVSNIDADDLEPSQQRRRQEN